MTSTQPPPLHHTTPISSQTPSSPPVHQIRASTPTRAPTPKSQLNKAPVKQVITKTTIQSKANATNLRNINVITKPSTPTITNKSISKVVSKVGYEESKFGATSFGYVLLTMLFFSYEFAISRKIVISVGRMILMMWLQWVVLIWRKKVKGFWVQLSLLVPRFVL